MTEYRRKGCKVHFKNSQEEISIELIFTKKDKDVDIRDFFSKIKKIPDIEIHFKKGHYELIARGEENVLEKVPKVMKKFQDFYEESFGGSALDNTNTNENVYHFNEKQSEPQKASRNYSGHSHDASAFSQSRLQEEKMPQTESYVGSLGSANSDYNTEVETVTVFQNSGNDSTASVHTSNIKTKETRQGIEQHNTHPRERVNEFPNEKPENDEDLDEKKKDLYGRTETTGSRDGEQAEGNRASNDDDDDDVAGEDPCGHKSDNETTGIAQGSRGHAESKGLNVNSNTTNRSVMHGNDEDDENNDLSHNADTKVKPRDDSEGRGENSNAEEHSKQKHGGETFF